MNAFRHSRTALALVICASWAGLAMAQLANPLIRPAPRDVAPMPSLNGAAAHSNQGARIPQARPVQESPIPQSMATPSLPTPPIGAGLSPHTAPDALAREELSGYSVTAIMDQFAVLRLSAPNAGDAKSQAGGENGGSGNNRASNRAPVLRVKTGTAVVIAGTKLYPVVSPSQVEFCLQQTDSPAIAIVSLESAVQKYTADARELVDPAVAARNAPIKQTNGGAAAGAGAAGTATPVGQTR